MPGQGNNAYIFPGVGLGVLCSGTKQVTDEMFFLAAETLAQLVTEETLATGCIYPPLTDIRTVSFHIAVRVCENAFATNLATITRPSDLSAFVRKHMYEPLYKTEFKPKF